MPSEASDNLVSLWSSFGHVIQGVWIELLVVVVAMYMYCWHSKRKASAASEKSSKIAVNRSQRDRQVEQGAKKSLTNIVRSKALGSSPRGDAHQLVQKLVISILQKGNKGNPTTLLDQYEILIRDFGTDWQRYVPDEQNARSLYVALVGCVIELPASAKTPTSRSQNAQRYSSESSKWRWIAVLLGDMRALGFVRSVDFYGSLLKMLVGAELNQEALSLYDSMVEDKIAPNNLMFISLLNVAVVCNESVKAAFFFEEVAKNSPPSLRTIMTILRVHGKNRDWKSATQLLERMKSLGTPPDNLVLNNVLGLCISSGEMAGAEQLLYRWKDIIDVISCNIILKGCVQQCDLAKAESILSGMCSNGPAPNLISYNTVMDCAVRCMQTVSMDRPSRTSTRDTNGSQGNEKSWNNYSSFNVIKRRPWELLEELISRGLEPDRYTCSTLVKGMHLSGCTTSDIDKAVELLRRIGAAALQTSGTGSSSLTGCNARLLEVLFNTLLDACVTVHDLDRLADIFDMMQQYQVSVSAVTYGTLIKAFGQAGRISRCHEVWADLRRSCIQPTIVTFGCYIDACVRNGDIEIAESIFESMAAEPKGVRPNAVIYTSLIRGFAQAKQPRKALELYRRMQQEGIEATSVTFNSVLDVVSRQLSESTTLQEVINDMCKANVTPDIVTYSILMKASCSSGQVQGALSLFRQIQSNGMMFDQVGFNTLLLACSKADLIADAEEIFQEMLKAGMTPTPVTTSIMVKMYGKAKMLEKAVTISELLEKDYDQKPNLHVYTCLIQACVQNKQVRRSWGIFNKMHQCNVEPDGVTYGTVIHGCVYLNKFQYAMSLVRHAYCKPRGQEDADNPFAMAKPLKQIVHLQPDVMHMLLSALRRKEQFSLMQELEEIMDEFNISRESRGKIKKNSSEHTLV